MISALNYKIDALFGGDFFNETFKIEPKVHWVLVKKTQASHSCKCPIYSTISYSLSFLLSLFFSIFLYLSQSLLQLVNELVGSSVSKLIETALPIWVSTRPLANSLSLILSTFPNPISVPPPFPLTG